MNAAQRIAASAGVAVVTLWIAACSSTPPPPDMKRPALLSARALRPDFAMSMPAPVSRPIFTISRLLIWAAIISRLLV